MHPTRVKIDTTDYNVPAASEHNASHNMFLSAYLPLHTRMLLVRRFVSVNFPATLCMDNFVRFKMRLSGLYSARAAKDHAEPVAANVIEQPASL